MKLKRFRCDRCGCCYDKNEIVDLEGRTSKNLVGVGLITTDRTIFRYDLCDSCLAYLQVWLRNEIKHPCFAPTDCYCEWHSRSHCECEPKDISDLDEPDKEVLS